MGCHMVVDSSRTAAALFTDLASEDQEVLIAAFLDSRNTLLSKKEIFRGTIDSSFARPREILRAALFYNAAKLVVAHNHPSGFPQPSQEDVEFTVRLKWATSIVGIPLLDHLIICSRVIYFSFADAKLLGQGHPQFGCKNDVP